ncbi:LCP family protein [Candidatus Saccharibacteria bacterium]|nr:LCP family protein [Candidatus Saccharibacteria bacterium]
MKKKKRPEPSFTYDPEADKAKSASRRTGKKTDPDFIFDPTVQADTPTEPADPLDMKNNLEKPVKKKKRWKKVLLTVFLVLLAAAIAYAIYALLQVSKISTNPFNFGKLKGENEGRVNILLLGVGDPGHDGEQLSDTNMVMSVNTKSNPVQVSLISIPRDTRVYIPGQGYAKINQANSYGGPQLAEQTVSETLGIPIQYYVTANFTGLKQAVDAVGGVDIRNNDSLSDPEYPCDNNQWRTCGFNLKPGDYRMDGTTALKYARCRKGTCGDDYGRAARQQQVLQAMREKALSLQTLSNPAKVTNLINTVGNNVKTDLSLNNMMRLRDLTKDVKTSDLISVVFSTKPNGFLKQDPYSSDLLPVAGNFDNIQAFVKDIFSLGPVWKEESNATIKNGTTTVGLALKLKSRIDADGDIVTIESVGNASSKDATATQIIDYTGGQKPNTAAYLEKMVGTGVKVSQPPEPVKNPTVDFEVILGSDYAQAQKPTTNEAP